MLSSSDESEEESELLEDPSESEEELSMLLGAGDEDWGITGLRALARSSRCAKSSSWWLII